MGTNILFSTLISNKFFITKTIHIFITNILATYLYDVYLYFVLSGFKLKKTTRCLLIFKLFLIVGLKSSPHGLC